MTAADAHFFRLQRLRRRLDEIEIEISELERRRSRVELVAAFLRCWAFGHPSDVDEGRGCRRCGGWVPVSAAEAMRRSSPAIVAAHRWERRQIGRCSSGGFHVAGDGPCFRTLVAAAAYRDRIEQAGVRWLPVDQRAIAPIPRPPVEVVEAAPALARLVVGEGWL